ncbi:hypothetical protein CR513_40814, partial [Mucuna pruriens]
MNDLDLKDEEYMLSEDEVFRKHESLMHQKSKNRWSKDVTDLIMEGIREVELLKEADQDNRKLISRFDKEKNKEADQELYTLTYGEINFNKNLVFNLLIKGRIILFMI